MKKALIRLLPNFVQADPERYLENKFLLQLLAFTVYFSLSGYGVVIHNDMLFWLNIPEAGKFIIIVCSIPFLFMGFMGVFILFGVMINLPFQIIKEIFRMLFEK